MKARHLIHLAFAATLPLHMGGCIFSSSRLAQSVTAARAPEPSAPAARVQAALVEAERARFAASPFVKAYVLVSEGGMVDQGQFFVMADADGRTALVRHYPPAERKAPAEKPVAPAVLASLAAEAAKAKDLKDFEEKSFDGVTFQYFAWSKDGRAVKVDKSLFMRNPGLDGGKAYDGLIAAFQKTSL